MATGLPLHSNALISQILSNLPLLLIERGRRITEYILNPTMNDSQSFNMQVSGCAFHNSCSIFYFILQFCKIHKLRILLNYNQLNCSYSTQECLVSQEATIQATPHTHHAPSLTSQQNTPTAPTAKSSDTSSPHLIVKSATPLTHNGCGKKQASPHVSTHYILHAPFP